MQVSEARPFILEEDAFSKLNLISLSLNLKSNMGSQEKEVMDDLEMRIAESFEEKLGSGSEVVTLQMVEEIISRLACRMAAPL